MIDPRTNIVGERVLITSRGQPDRKVFGRGVVRAVDLQGGIFTFLIEAVGVIDLWGCIEDGELFQISTGMRRPW